MKPIAYLARLSLRAYKLVVSPTLHTLAGPMGGCRFTPTCSEYAAQALQRHGLWVGARLALVRLCRCHPWGRDGYDPVPEPAAQSAGWLGACAKSAVTTVEPQEPARLAGP